jgi:hypothetical protein
MWFNELIQLIELIFEILFSSYALGPTNPQSAIPLIPTSSHFPFRFAGLLYFFPKIRSTMVCDSVVESVQ